MLIGKRSCGTNCASDHGEFGRKKDTDGICSQWIYLGCPCLLRYRFFSFDSSRQSPLSPNPPALHVLRPCRRCGSDDGPLACATNARTTFCCGRTWGQSRTHDPLRFGDRMCVCHLRICLRHLAGPETSESPANRTRGGFATRRNSGFFSSTSLACPFSGRAPSDPVGFGGCARLFAVAALSPMVG